MGWMDALATAWWGREGGSSPVIVAGEQGTYEGILTC